MSEIERPMLTNIAEKVQKLKANIMTRILVQKLKANIMTRILVQKFKANIMTRSMLTNIDGKVQR